MAPSTTARLAAVDAARGLAVLGMFAAHVGPPASTGRIAAVLDLSNGRAPGLFAVLAGLSMALADRGGARSRRGLLVRCVYLMALGLFLASLDSGVIVILSFYAVYFLLAFPFLRLRPRTLALTAGLSLIAGPLVWYAVRAATGWKITGAAPDLDALLGIDGWRDLLFTGGYPAVTWLPLLLAGLALGRLAVLTDRPSQLRLFGLGAALTVVGYGGSHALVRLFDVRGTLLADVAANHPWALEETNPVSAVLTSGVGAIPATDPAWLLLSGPYSNTPFELVGLVGFSFAVIGGLLWLNVKWAPLVAVGTLALSAYIVHVLVLAEFWPGEPAGTNLLRFTGFAAVALAGCRLWSRFIGRGPFEAVERTAVRAVATPKASPAPVPSPAARR